MIYTLKKLIVMKTYLKTALILVLAVVVTACAENNPRSGKTRSTGNTAEIMVVVQNPEQWEGRIGDSLRHFFCDYQYGLPQPEQRYDLKYIMAAGFSDLFKSTKCIIEVVIDPTLEKAVAETAEDLWAAPQRYVKISAPTLTDWVELFDQQKEVYLQWFDKVERERILNVLRPTTDLNIEKTIAENFGFTMTVPQGFYVAKVAPDFMWLRKELERSSADIVIYRTPYVDTLQFEASSLVSMRNMMEGQHIPGPSEGSYMGTEVEFVPPLVTTALGYPVGYDKEMRGMWKVENDFMGGPFVSYTFVDPRVGKLVTVEGFYYEPNQKKRNMLFQLEALAYSVRFVEE